MRPARRLSLLTALALGLSFPCFAQSADNSRQLEMGNAIEREMKGGDAHSYLVTLESGQFMKVIVDQRGIDVVVSLFHPDGQLLKEVDSPNGTKGPEPISVLAKASGKYRIEVRSLEKDAPTGRYEIRLEALRLPSPQDRAEDLAASLAAAKTDDERMAIMPKDKELLTVDLERLLVKHSVGLVEQGQHERALALCRLALIIAEQRGSREAVAGLWGNIGTIFMAKGDYVQAMEAYQKSLTISEELEDKRAIIRLHFNMGVAQVYQGNYPEALEHDRKYLAMAEATGNKGLIARVMPSIGAVYHAEGDYGRALEYYQKALSLFEELGDKFGVGVALNNIGGIYYAQGNYAQALEYHQKSLALGEEMLVKAGGNSMMLIRKSVAEALGNIASDYHELGNYPRAVEFYQKSLALFEALGEQGMMAATLSNLGETYESQGDYSQALEHFQKSLRISEAVGDRPQVSHTLGRIGDYYLARGNPVESLKFEERSSQLARQIGNLEALWYSLVTAAKAYRVTGHPAEAQMALDEAIATIETLRTQVAGGEQEQQRFFEDKGSPYQEIVGLLVSQNNLAEALVRAERAKARVLLDVLSSGKANVSKAMNPQEHQQESKLKSELISLNRQIASENQHSPPDQQRLADLKVRLAKMRLDYEAFQNSLYATHPQLKAQRGEAQPIKLGEVAHLLPDLNSAALEFVVTEDKTYLFVLTKNDERSQTPINVKAYALAIKQKELSARTEAYRKQLAQGDLEFQQTARSLYELLLKPAEDQLRGKTTLLIVPDGELWDLPFQALQRSPNHYVIEDQAIFYAPSLTVLREMVKARGRPADQKVSSVSTLLAFGNPAVTKQTAERAQRVLMDEKLEPLPEAEKQVAALQQLYGPAQSKVYVGAEAREDRAKAEAGSYRVLQFATHGVLNDSSPMYSHLVLSQTEGDSDEDGLLEAWEMMNLDLHADMVVLSACETARGRVSAGEGVIGMSWALFVAGAPTAVVSQWKVESASTTELMLAFHRNLKAGMRNARSPMSKAGAMQQASIKLLRSGKYSHPFYWAGFVVVGDGY